MPERSSLCLSLLGRTEHGANSPCHKTARQSRLVFPRRYSSICSTAENGTHMQRTGRHRFMALLMAYLCPALGAWEEATVWPLTPRTAKQIVGELWHATCHSASMTAGSAAINLSVNRMAAFHCCEGLFCTGHARLWLCRTRTLSYTPHTYERSSPVPSLRHPHCHFRMEIIAVT